MSEHRLTIPIRWRDLDFLGHLNQAVYHELLEEARASFLMGLGSGHTYVLARIELDYRHEVRKDHESVGVVVRVGRIGESSFVLEHDIELPDGTVAATGSSVMVGWNPGTRGKRVLDEDERAALGA